MTETLVEVIGGVDTHADTHTAAAVDTTGRLLGHQQFPTDPDGYRQLLDWLASFGRVRQVGVEGTGSYGVGLYRHLHAQGISVIEVDRPSRKTRRRRGKSDSIDAETAARAVLAGTATTVPKTRTGIVETLRVITTTRATAVKARTAAKNALTAIARTAPEPLRSQLTGLATDRLIAAAADLKPGFDMTEPCTATALALRRLARRCHNLAAEIREADLDLELILRELAPDLLARPGVGPATAAQLLITAGDNPQRLRAEAAFAMLCGAAPLPASSGRTDRHRLNRAGDRQANKALHTIALSRSRHHPETRAYIDRRTSQGLSDRDIRRCLKRYIARELFTHIQNALHRHTPTTPAPQLSTT
ncbi:IS110 family transposase [Paractinoplanes lichenicola]|uniref:IS110 family transposase n=1 Tax=Paractinoplanes lichenicola TaxID=2802976 RepID=A0ABS1W5C3_9ACTN|nr:IS110 family transposase [Actinoplanes lichenicola]MBL7261934.1 IS110 family transposase [Actinoplanes lichenicola]